MSRADDLEIMRAWLMSDDDTDISTDNQGRTVINLSPSYVNAIARLKVDGMTEAEFKAEIAAAMFDLSKKELAEFIAKKNAE